MASGAEAQIPSSSPQTRDGDVLENIVRRLPRWVSLAIGAALVAAAVVLAVRPLTSIVVLAAGLGVAAVVVAGLLLREPGWARAIGGAVALTLAIALVTVFPQTVAVLPIVLLGLAALRAGAGAGNAFRSRAPWGTRVRRIAWCVLVVLLGMLAVLVPDVAVVLTGVTFAIALAVVGVRLVVRVLRTSRPATTRGAAWRAAGAWVAVVALIATTGATGAGVLALQSAQTPVTSFYEWDDEIPDVPGTLLRLEQYGGPTPQGATAYRILYSTTRADGSLAVASAVVVVPERPSDRSTVLAWQHGTTGVARQCGPSLGDNAITDEAVPGIQGAIDRGWTVVATDYPGQGTDGRYPYLIGEGEGRATLDGIRAAQQLTDVGTFDDVLLWGHSQGGHASLWAAQLAGTYAPELHITAVAALSAASDPLQLAKDILATQSPLSAIVASFVLVPYADEYPSLSLSDVTHPGGLALAQSMASRCAIDSVALVSYLVMLGVQFDSPLFTIDLEQGPSHDLLVENIPSGDFTAPLFLGQGTDDEAIPIEIQRAFSERVCDAGHDVTVHEYPGYSHMGVIAADSPLPGDLYAWADEVLAGETPNTCAALP